MSCWLHVSRWFEIISCHIERVPKTDKTETSSCRWEKFATTTTRISFPPLFSHLRPSKQSKYDCKSFKPHNIKSFVSYSSPPCNKCVMLLVDPYQVLAQEDLAQKIYIPYDSTTLPYSLLQVPKIGSCHSLKLRNVLLSTGYKNFRSSLYHQVLVWNFQVIRQNASSFRIESSTKTKRFCARNISNATFETEKLSARIPSLVSSWTQVSNDKENQKDCNNNILSINAVFLSLSYSLLPQNNEITLLSSWEMRYLQVKSEKWWVHLKAVVGCV